MNILLLEPDRVLADLYCQALSADGHDVALCLTAQSAVHHCDSEQPDIVIMELQLAKHNGIEFLYEFRSYPEWQHIPVILLSAVPAADVLTPVVWDQLNVSAYYYKSRTSLATICSAVADVRTFVQA